MVIPKLRIWFIKAGLGYFKIGSSEFEDNNGGKIGNTLYPTWITKLEHRIITKLKHLAKNFTIGVKPF